MKKNFSKLLFAVCAFVPCSFLLTGCGEAKLTDLSVDLTNSTFVISNNTITVEYGENLGTLVEDFAVTANFSDKSTKQITKQTELDKGYTIETTIPSSEGATAVGNYTITFNYEGKSQTVNVNVVEKIINIGNLTWTDASNFVYDGTQKTVVITSTLPEHVSVSYANNVKTDAGNYTATATFTCDSNYAVSTETLTYSYEIQKANIDVSNVALENNTYVYDGTQKSVTLTGVPTGVQVNIVSGGSATDVGNYTAVVEFTVGNNYNKPQNKE